MQIKRELRGKRRELPMIYPADSGRSLRNGLAALSLSTRLFF